MLACLLLVFCANKSSRILIKNFTIYLLVNESENIKITKSVSGDLYRTKLKKINFVKLQIELDVIYF